MNPTLSAILVIIAAAAGLASHYLKKLAELRASGDKTGFAGYWLANPYQTLLSLATTVGTMAALYHVGELNGITAFACGYVSNSVADIIGSRVPRA